MRYIFPISFLLVISGFVWAFIGLPDGRLLFSSLLVVTLAAIRGT